MDEPAPVPPGEVVIGADAGTTAVKVSAFGVGSPWRHTVVREYPLLHPQPGWEVQDPDVIVTALVGALGECVQRCEGARVLAISLSTAMHGLLGLDGDRRPVTPLVTWADSRAHEQARALREDGQAAWLHRTTGTPVHPMSPLVKLLWFAQHDPATWARVHTWAGLKEHIVAALTGTVATELSCASGTGLLDLATRTWSPACLDLASVSAQQLPPVLEPTAALELTEPVASRVGLPAGTPVVLGAGDGPLGNLGVGAMAPGVAGLSVGTSGALRMVVDEPWGDPQGRLFCYALTAQKWVVGGAVSNGGSAIRWAGDVFGPDSDEAPGGSRDEHVLALAETVPVGSDGLVMVPYLLGERAPLWDPDLPGAYLGVRSRHTRGHFVRATVEGVGLQLATLVRELERVSPVSQIRATGGVFRSTLWREILAGCLARPLVVVGGAEGSALGAAVLGLVAVGRAGSLDEARAALTVGAEDAQPPVVAPHDQVAQYRTLARSLSELVDKLRQVAAMAAAPDTGEDVEGGATVA